MLKTPECHSTEENCRFLQKATHYFLINSEMYKKRKDRVQLLVILGHERRLRIMEQAHEELGHRGSHGVFYHLRDRFYWPHMYQDI